jgi:hypothetical protein
VDSMNLRKIKDNLESMHMFSEKIVTAVIYGIAKCF